MKIKRHVIAAWLALVAASSASAQSSPQPLNLNLPPDAAGTYNASATPLPTGKGDPGINDNAIVDAMDASNPPIGPARKQSRLPYDPDRRSEDSGTSAARGCDDAKYGASQLHGSATVDVIGGSHASGNYQSGVVSVSKAFGSCDHPTGGASISIGVERENLDGHRHGWR